ncbi:MAG TPA: sulfite exporter TauE/SafE family protein [Candidatus Eisenbacteria bacterium]|jgi:hypothetical protein
MMGADLLPAIGVGLLGGALVGLTGVGAGSVIAALLLVCYQSVAPQTIVGSATLQAVAMKLVGVWARRQFQLRERRLGVAMAAGAIPLAVAGAWVSSRLSDATLRPVVSAVLIAVGGTLIVQAAQARRRARPETALAASDPAQVQIACVGAGVGFIAGLTSVGTGTLFVSALVGPLGVAARRAVGAALVAGLLTLSVSGATHLLLGHVDPGLVFGTCLGSVPGVLFGTAFSQRLRTRALRGLIGTGIIVAALVSMAPWNNR